MPIARTESGDIRRATDRRPLYVCDKCGKMEPWSNDWAWYGSYKQSEDFGMKGVAPIKTMCSAACRIALVAAGDLPAAGLDDTGEVVDEIQHRQIKRR
jgi:hypothetical protein